jgi:hypothetical protein
MSARPQKAAVSPWAAHWRSGPEPAITAPPSRPLFRGLGLIAPHYGLAADKPPELKETGITRALFEREPMTIRRYRCLNFCSGAVSQIGQASIDLSAAKSNEAQIWDTGGPISHTKRTTCCSIRQQFAGIQSNSCRTPQALQAPPSIQANR